MMSDNSFYRTLLKKNGSLTPKMLCEDDRNN